MYKDMSRLWIATSPESPASIEQSPHKWLCECLVMINGVTSGTLLKTYMFSLPAICTSSPRALRAESTSSFAPLHAVWAIGKAWRPGNSPCKEHHHHCQGATMGTQAHLLMPKKAQKSTLLPGSWVAWRAKRGKNFFLGCCCQLTQLWCTCVSRQHFHIRVVCFNMSNSWCFWKVSLAPSSLLSSTFSIK